MLGFGVVSTERGFKFADPGIEPGTSAEVELDNGVTTGETQEDPCDVGCIFPDDTEELNDDDSALD